MKNIKVRTIKSVVIEETCTVIDVKKDSKDKELYHISFDNGRKVHKSIDRLFSPYPVYGLSKGTKGTYKFNIERIAVEKSRKVIRKTITYLIPYHQGIYSFYTFECYNKEMVPQLKEEYSKKYFEKLRNNKKI